MHMRGADAMNVTAYEASLEVCTNRFQPPGPDQRGLRRCRTHCFGAFPNAQIEQPPCAFYDKIIREGNARRGRITLRKRAALLSPPPPYHGLCTGRPWV